MDSCCIWAWVGPTEVLDEGWDLGYAIVAVNVGEVTSALEEGSDGGLGGLEEFGGGGLGDEGGVEGGEGGWVW